MARHAAPKKPLINVSTVAKQYAAIMGVTLAIVGGTYLLPSYADAPPVVSVNYNQPKYIGSGIGPDYPLHTGPFTMRPVLPALDLGDK